MTDDSDDIFLTVVEAAELLRVNRRTLDNLRWKNVGPPYRRHGGRIIYSRKELLEWSKRCRSRTPTPDKSPKVPPEKNGAHGPGPIRGHVPKAERPKPPLEREPQRSDRPLQPELTPAE